MRLFALLFLFASVSLGELIPASRLATWTPGTHTGVPGGVKQYQVGGASERTNLIDVTQAPYNADNTGATDAQSAIQSAINAASSGDVVYLPAGTYRIDSALIFGQTRSGITMRGAGVDSVTIDNRASVGILVGVESGTEKPPFGATRADCVISAGLSQGSETVTIVDTTAFVVGNMMRIVSANDPDLPVYSTGGTDFLNTQTSLASQQVRLVSKTATTLTFWPPLRYDFGGGDLDAEAWAPDFQVNLVGLEDFTIDNVNGSYGGIRFSQTYGCWVSNVECLEANNYPISLFDSLFAEVRRCKFTTKSVGGSNGAGMLLNYNYSALIEDNIVYHAAPLIEVNFGSSGNVFGYNIMEDSIQGIGMDSNHGPHCMFNLYEGNVVLNIKPDGYFGSVSDDTVFRNFLHADGGDDTNGIYLKRLTRRYNVVGNVHRNKSYGEPNIGNSASSGTAQLSMGDPWDDYGRTGVLTTRTSNTAGTVTLDASRVFDGATTYVITIYWGSGSHTQFSVTGISGSQTEIAFTGAGGAGSSNLPDADTALDVFMGPTGYQELDLDVEATTIDKGNYDLASETMTSLGGDPLPDSMYTTREAMEERGVILGNRSFPPFSPLSPLSASYDDIAAGYRFQNNGDDPPAEDGSSTTISGSSGSTTISGSGPTTIQ